MRKPLLVAMLVLLTTCGVEATTALTPLSSARLDKSLLGTWTDGDGMVFIVTNSKGPLLRVEITKEKEKKAEPMLFAAHVSELGALRILNLRSLEKGESNVLFVRYVKRDDGAIELSLMKEKLFVEALNGGTLRGHRGQYGGTVLEDTPERITAFILKQKSEELFDPLTTVTRRP